MNGVPVSANANNTNLRIGLGIVLLGLTVSLSHAGIISGNGYVQSATEDGGTTYLDPYGSSSLRVKTIDNNFYRPGPQAGSTVHGVNLMTGQPLYPVPIGTISAGGEVAFPISFTFGGPIRQQYDADNDRGPTSWIGYGWNFSAPFVSVNHKGTLTYDDDVFFCDLGPYGGGQILQSTDATGRIKYVVSSNPAITVIPTFDSEGFIADWEFVTPNGARLVFGRNDNSNNAKRTILRNAQLLGATPYNLLNPMNFTYRWDISTMSDNFRQNRLIFKYNRIQKILSGSAGYTQESYLQDVISMNSANVEIERYTFVTTPKTIGVDYPVATDPEYMSQKLFETKLLNKIQHFSEGVMDRVYTLAQSIKAAAPPDFPYQKSRLTNISIQILNPQTGAMVTVPKMGWTFDYDDTPNRHSGLKNIYKPNFGRDVYTYGRPNYDYQTKDANGNVVYPFRQETAQDAPIQPRILKDAPGLIDDGRVLSKWQTETFCSEKYCVIASEYNEPTSQTMGDLLFMEIWKTDGNNFQQVQTYNTYSKFSNSFKIIPMGDDFILVSSRGKVMIDFAWNGTNFTTQFIHIQRVGSNGLKTQIDPIVSPNGTDELKVTSTGTYLIVQDQNYYDACSYNTTVVNKSKVYVLRKINGVWVEQNENECSVANKRTCALDNNPPAVGNPPTQSYGEPYKSTTGCMEFDGRTLWISGTPKMFHVVDDACDIIFSYAANPTGQGFTNITDSYSFVSVGGPLQRTGYPNNWERNILNPILFGNDYFIIKSNNRFDNTSRFDIMHYTGTSIVPVGSVADRADNITDPQYGATLNVWPSGDYFLLTDQSAKLAEGYFKQITKDASNNPTGMSFAKVTIRTDLPDAGSGDVVARASENAFTLEYYPNGTAAGGVPTAAPLTEATTLKNYKTYLYVTDKSLWGNVYYKPYNHPSGQFLDANGRNYFDVTFSPSENLLTARNGNVTGGGACVPGQTCITGFVTSPTLSVMLNGSSDYFIRKTTPVYMAWDGPAATLNQKIISPSGRIAAISILNSSTNKSQFLLLKNMGQGYTQYPYQVGSVGLGDINFVQTFSTYSDISNPSGTDGDRHTDYTFNYAPVLDQPDVTQYPSYNANTQTFIFPNTMVIESHVSRAYPTPGRGIAATTITHFASTKSNFVTDPDLMKVGLVTGQVSRRVNLGTFLTNFGDPFSTSSNSYSTLQGLPGWPANLKTPVLSSTVSTTYAPNKSFRNSNVSFHAYYAPASTFLFEKSKVGSVWYLKQRIFNPTGVSPAMPVEMVTYRLTSEPLAADLDTWPSWSPYSMGSALEQVVSAVQYQYDQTFPYKVNNTNVWKDVDGTLTDEELSKGTDPVFMLTPYFQGQSKVVRRNGNSQVLEMATILSDANQVEEHTVYFYEGKGALPIGQVSNAYYNEAAILTAENGSMPSMSTHDLEGRWSKADAGPSTKQAHTGRYSIKVADNQAGPWINLKLRSSFPQGYEYVISAWIFGESSSAPSLIAERFRAGTNTVLPGSWIKSTPVSGNYAANTWQRYEIRIPAAQLIGTENLFVTGAADFLRVRAVAGATGRVAYVDDIVCRPNISTFSSSAYDGFGRITSATNSDYLTQWFEYDVLGNRTGVRDDKYRIFNLSATHLPGEND